MATSKAEERFLDAEQRKVDRQIAAIQKRHPELTREQAEDRWWDGDRPSAITMVKGKSVSSKKRVRKSNPRLVAMENPFPIGPLTDSPAPHGRPVDPGIQNPGFAGLGLFALAVLGLIGYGVFERSKR